MVNSFTSNTLFGSLLADEEVAGLFSAESFLQNMLAFEIAWSKALAEFDIVSSSSAETACRMMEQFRPSMDELGAASGTDGLPVPELVRRLRVAATSDVGKAIHTGATSQDVIDTAMVMTLHKAGQLIHKRLENIRYVLRELQEKHGDNTLMLRTRMQAALPGHVRDRLRAWQQGIDEAIYALEQGSKANQSVQIGGPVGRQDFPDPARAEAFTACVASHLGLGAAPVWHTQRKIMVDAGHQYLLITSALGKIGADIILMAQQEPREIELTGGGGSSAMPHKQNPVHAESLVTLARYVAGQQGILGQAMIHEQERSGAAWNLEWLCLPAMAEAAGAALNNAHTCLSQVQRIGMTAPD